MPRFNRDWPYNNLPLLPPSAEIETLAIFKQAISANRKLAELKGRVSSIPNQDILLRSIGLQESRRSSEIENIITTNGELFKADAGEHLAKDPHSKEVLRYREALWYGYDAIKTKPLSTNLFIQIVKIIKAQDIGIRRIPGTKIANSKGEIIYTPPEGEDIIYQKLSNLEQFIHKADDWIDPLIKLAIMHYQFEAIHPFVDGNGRTGRIINILFLVEQSLLDSPILFLSSYILHTKSDYYQKLQQVTEEGKWEAWILYILLAVEKTAMHTSELIIKIRDLMDSARELIRDKAPQIYSKDLVEIIFRHPYCKIGFFEEIAKRQTASIYLKTLEKIGLLTAVKIGRVNYYVNERLFKLLSQPPSFKDPI